MDKREAIEYLKDRMKDIPALAKLKYNNMEYSLWIRTIRGVIEKVFGKNSYEYQQLAEVYKISGSFDETRQNSYKLILQKRAAAIMSIIQTWEATGFETKEDSEPLVAFDLKANWKDISKQFGITKIGFGKRINFITDPFRRIIIFRDVEQAFVLASLGFSKPAVILAGSVIEELLRLYLKYKNIPPLSNNFDGYIKTCEQNGLLKDSVSRLSDVIRQFRNLVHLSAEETEKHTISKATAIGAVSSIFTIANDF
jgi:hypothetical protein